MKKCPECAEEIQDAAIKCRHCKADLPVVDKKTVEVKPEPPMHSPVPPQPAFSERDKKVIRMIGKGFAILLLLCLTPSIWWITLPILAIWLLRSKIKMDAKKKWGLVIGLALIPFIVTGIVYAQVPRLTFTEPADNSVTQADTIVVKGKVTPSTATVILNDKTISPDKNGNFSYDFLLNRGKNVLSYSARSGNRSSWPWTLTVQRDLTEAEVAEEKRKKEAEEQTKAEVKITEFREQLKSEIANTKEYKTDRSTLGDNVGDGVIFARAFFKSWATDVKVGRASKDPETVKLANELAKQTSRVQAAMYPIMRKAFAETASAKLWRADGSVRVIGAGNTIIIFTSHTYAANSNVADSYEALQDVLMNLRFSQVRYEWYVGSEYQAYDVSDVKDGELEPKS